VQTVIAQDLLNLENRPHTTVRQFQTVITVTLTKLLTTDILHTRFSTRQQLFRQQNYTVCIARCLDITCGTRRSACACAHFVTWRTSAV